MWTVLFGAPELSEQEMDALCYKLQVYLVHSLDTCGWKILSQVLFTETDDPEEYYESLSELRQKGYEEVLQRARRRIQEVRLQHGPDISTLVLPLPYSDVFFSCSLQLFPSTFAELVDPRDKKTGKLST
ncbi:hypothetical protein llap_20466 [Limosa lapponica baueri]|uniref:JMY/WHAMM N-terminal domain-containing protein n=1 Tax=Limosa lapponica baueri TaxID=1758121 RepID=A0A2I0T618_LIMLA|nr:hypothetical protein llap_20466 [Limosa lapponica baueri]